VNKNITLPNGAVLTWEQFNELPESQQEQIMRDFGRGEDDQWSIDISQTGLPTGKYLLPRIRAAAERNAITEDELLAFIKTVHDIFFPPEPKKIIDGVQVIPGKSHRKNVKGGFMKYSKPVITPAGEFPSMACAGRYYQVEGSRIRSWIKGGKAGFQYKSG
jgi:hypothetical protein